MHRLWDPPEGLVLVLQGIGHRPGRTGGRIKVEVVFGEEYARQCTWNAADILPVQARAITSIAANARLRCESVRSTAC